MRHRAALAAMTLLLVACDQRAPTEPGRVPEPAFQVGQDQVRVSLSRNAEWNSESQITVNGSFTCPENQTAFFSVQVTQAKANGVTQGFGSGQEVCKFGSNKWSVTVFASFFPGWDMGPAVAVVSMFTPSGPDTDQGDINIR